MSEETDETRETAVQPDPQAIAYAVLLKVADEPEQVGEFVAAEDLGDHVTDFRFASAIRGYEGWQWSVTLFHDEELDSWTVDESSLVPTDQALMPPQWIPWKDRLEPTDLSPTDSIGTDLSDGRLEQGDVEPSSLQDVNDVAEEFRLTRRHVLTPLGRSQIAKRWYEGPRGPKSLSTKTAEGNLCSTCGFFVPLKGDLGQLFGVCANKWSPDDGRVVSLDHGCGEHSEIEPPEPSHLWIQSKPAFDDLHIDVVARRSRVAEPTPEDEEKLANHDHEDDDADADDILDATEEDIIANTEVDDDEDDVDAETDEETHDDGNGVSPELETVVNLIEQLAAAKAFASQMPDDDAKQDPAEEQDEPENVDESDASGNDIADMAKNDESGAQ